MKPRRITHNLIMLLNSLKQFIEHMACDKPTNQRKTTHYQELPATIKEPRILTNSRNIKNKTKETRKPKNRTNPEIYIDRTTTT